jgi:hypothetical protein
VAVGERVRGEDRGEGCAVGGRERRKGKEREGEKSEIL